MICCDYSLPFRETVNETTVMTDPATVGYIDRRTFVHELQFNGSSWSDIDLTLATIGTPAGSVSALDGYFGKDGSRHTNYIDGPGHVREVYVPGRP